jgi:hypothetical protein
MWFSQGHLNYFHFAGGVSQFLATRVDGDLFSVREKPLKRLLIQVWCWSPSLSWGLMRSRKTMCGLGQGGRVGRFHIAAGRRPARLWESFGAHRPPLQGEILVVREGDEILEQLQTDGLAFLGMKLRGVNIIAANR